MNYKEIEGNLITLAKEGSFDVIAHGCNCFCAMGSGIAPQMAAAFGCDKFLMESHLYKGDLNKLGDIDFEVFNPFKDTLIIVNAYTQYSVAKEPGDVALDYEALTLCMRKINYNFTGRRVGLPQIGCGLAGGDWDRVKQIIQTELKDCEVTVVIFKP